MTQRKCIFISVVILSIGLISCNNGEDMMKEKLTLEGEVSAKKQIEAENQNLQFKAEEMEQDLRVRHRFYQAVRGTYEGKMQTEQGEFKIRVTLYPSISPYKADRVRVLDEITADLNNLYFNVQIVQWNPANSLSAVGCRIVGVRPDLTHGEINIASENCPNFYALQIAAGINDEGIRDQGRSSAVAEQIREGRINQVPQILGQVQPSTNSSIYQFSLKRTE